MYENLAGIVRVAGWEMSLEGVGVVCTPRHSDYSVSWLWLALDMNDVDGEHAGLTVGRSSSHAPSLFFECTVRISGTWDNLKLHMHSSFLVRKKSCP
jgi:hypothetical protein